MARAEEASHEKEDVLENVSNTQEKVITEDGTHVEAKKGDEEKEEMQTGAEGKPIVVMDEEKDAPNEGNTGNDENVEPAITNGAGEKPVGDLTSDLAAPPPPPPPPPPDAGETETDRPITGGVDKLPKKLDEATNDAAAGHVKPVNRSLEKELVSEAAAEDPSDDAQARAPADETHPEKKQKLMADATAAAA